MRRIACNQWLAVSVLTCIAVIGRDALANVPQDPTAIVPVEIGAPAPTFVATEADGKPYRFAGATVKKPTMLIFYRGGWCPYCNTHLQDLRIVEPQIVALGYQVLFLSTDRPDLLYASLKKPLGYHILSDSSMNAAEAFGVAYHVDDATLKDLKSYGIDLNATQGSAKHELPVPSVFIVDAGGVVRFRYFNADFRVRLDAQSVLAAARDHAGKH